MGLLKKKVPLCSVLLAIKFINCMFRLIFGMKYSGKKAAGNESREIVILLTVGIKLVLYNLVLRINGILEFKYKLEFLLPSGNICLMRK